MATEKDVNDLFLNHVNSNDVKTRKMMGEYIIYYDGVVIGGLYDNRLLVKATKSARHQFQDNTFKANIIPNSWESLVLSIKYQLAPTVLIPTPNAEIISAKKNNLKFLIFNKSVINITFFQCKIYICELFYKLRVV